MTTSRQTDLPPIAPMLSAIPAGFAPRISDRAAWNKAGHHPGMTELLSAADHMAHDAPASMTRELFHEYWTHDDATKWNTGLKVCAARLLRLVLAECVRNDGNLLPAIHREISTFCDAPFWISPGHDWECENRDGIRVTIDLHSAMSAWSLATADWMLGDTLSQDLRCRIRQEIQRRVFQPYRECAIEGKRPLWWLTETNNWNAVCHAGVVGAALALIDSREERAAFIATARTYLRHYLDGFSPDGGSSEGITYWNYGFSHYVFLSESVRAATSGAVVLLDDPRIPDIARFAPRMEIQNAIFPAFSDSNLRVEPSAWTVGILSRRLGLGLTRWENRLGGNDGWLNYELYSSAMVLFTDPGPDAGKKASHNLALRDWFPDRQIYIGRQDDSSLPSVALKGGNNAEHHNHNDLGSFTVVISGQSLVLDVGRELYNKRTFSKHRYDSPLNNSYGHPVPIINGKMQIGGPDAAAVCLKACFTDQSDEVVLDLTRAYDAEGLQSIIRHFTYKRGPSGYLEVRDEMRTTRPMGFGTALILTDSWRQINPQEIQIFNEKACLLCTLECSEPVNVSCEKLDVITPERFIPVRLGLTTRFLATQVLVRIRYSSSKKRII